MFKINIKSNIHSYQLNEISNFHEKLVKIYLKGDIILIDKKILNLYFNKKRINEFITITANERTKEYQAINKIINKILSKNFSKQNKIIAIGGGITQDIVSFISKILFRGVDWVFFPTTLLAQCDSCIGGKVSINFRNFKNQIGFFNPPKFIFNDTSFLKTLSKKDVNSGIGEMMHYYYVSSRKDFNFFSKNIDDLLKNNNKVLKRIIFKTILIKKKFIEKDEFDTEFRLLLNYGHTFGHAIESVTNYSIPHGIAVAHGMNISNYVSYKYNYLSKNNYNLMKKTIEKISSKMFPSRFSIQKYKKALYKDKKVLNKKLRLILTKGPGKMFIKTMPYSMKFEKILIGYFKENYKF